MQAIWLNGHSQRTASNNLKCKTQMVFSTHETVASGKANGVCKRFMQNGRLEIICSNVHFVVQTSWIWKTRNQGPILETVSLYLVWILQTRAACNSSVWWLVPLILWPSQHNILEKGRLCLGDFSLGLGVWALLFRVNRPVVQAGRQMALNAPEDI